MHVRYLAPARDEFLRAIDFYEGQAVGLGAEFLAEMERTEQRVAANPELGSPYDEGTRRTLLQRFPFAVIYEVQEDHILVVAVAHQRRRPGYWRARRR